MEILVVEDDEIARTMIAATLAGCGHQVLIARDGEEALSILRSTGCRLVISDWEMPRMNGLELCRAIRAEDLLGYVYTILLTGRDSLEDTVAGLSAGADDFITKPFHPNELVARIATGERVLGMETRDVAIFALAKLAESRDVETGAHLERVQSYSRLLAQNLSRREAFRKEIDAEFIRLIYQTSPLHDIGKVGIPDTVLLKPGRLSDREFEIMKYHTVLGAQTLNAALEKFPKARFLLTARDIAAHHHERFDGSGYPDGLKGRAIPLSARIMAVADVYDALTSKRVYKPAFTHEVASPIIISETHAHFDPDVVEAFTQEQEQFLEIRRRFSAPGEG